MAKAQAAVCDEMHNSQFGTEAAAVLLVENFACAFVVLVVYCNYVDDFPTNHRIKQ